MWWESLPDLYPTIEQLIAEDDKVVVVCTFTATHRVDLPMGPTGLIKAKGRMLNLPIIYVFRLAEGRIVEGWESRNDGSLWQQLGATITPPPAAASS